MKRKEFSTAQKSLSIKAKAKKALVGVVVPCEPGGDPSASLQALRALPKAEKALVGAVYVAWGRHPSRQRNLAVAALRTPWVLFLDSDSRAQPGLISGLLEIAQRFDAVAAGGPNLALDDEPGFGRVADQVLTSWAGSGASRARYGPVGRARLCSEKELILCNLLMDRAAFMRAGGFREDLYPNEENELFNRLQAQGLRLAYEPKASVRRPRRRSLGAFMLQAFRYGRGRSQQMRRNAFASDLVNLAPAALQLALLGALCVPRGLWAWATYAGACLLSQRLDIVRAALLVLRHQAYALGLFAGAFQDPAPHAPQVRLQRSKL